MYKHLQILQSIERLLLYLHVNYHVINVQADRHKHHIYIPAGLAQALSHLAIITALGMFLHIFHIKLKNYSTQSP